MARLTRTAWELEDGLQPLVALAGCGSVENGMGSIAGRGGRPRCGRVGNPLHRQHGGARSPARGRGKKSTQQAEQLGRSRGGLTTKIHARVDGAGRLFTLLLTLGQQHDSTVAQQLMQQGAIHNQRRGRPALRPGYLSLAITSRLPKLVASAGCITSHTARLVNVPINSFCPSAERSYANAAAPNVHLRLAHLKQQYSEPLSQRLRNY